MWTQVSPIAFASIGWKYYLVFISCCVASAIVMLFTYPNTLGKSLEDVALMFGDHDLLSPQIREDGQEEKEP
jgi:hypothetical protein